MKRTIALSLTISALFGCSAHTGSSGYRPAFTKKTFNAELGKAAVVNTGDTVYVEGSYVEGEAIDIPEPLDMMLPGSLMFPFPVHIEAGRLTLARMDGSWKYYCAEEGRAAASFPGLGSVIAPGDCVGIRISQDGKRRRWVVDNSRYNGSTAIWDKSMTTAESATYLPRATKSPFSVDELTQITFDGYYGGQLHFTFEEISRTGRDTRTFTFDFANEPTLVGIRGNLLRALHADNVSLTYEWVKVN